MSETQREVHAMAHDFTILAGTAGAGVRQSADGGASSEAGVYRSADGGGSWAKTAREFGEIQASAWTPG